MFTNLLNSCGKNFSQSFFLNSFSKNTATSFFNRSYRHFSTYEKLLQLRNSTDLEKYEKIVTKTLGQTLAEYGFSKKTVKVSDISELVYRCRKVVSFPITSLKNSKNLSLEEKNNFANFSRDERFVNFVYNKIVRGWSDRTALQKLIRDDELFCKFFRDGDVVVIPGCADGQIALELAASAKKNKINLHIVAADVNLVAMEATILLMKSYGIDYDNIHWIHADVTSNSFFSWLESKFPKSEYKNPYQVTTLIQPCLSEKNMMIFLKKVHSICSLNGNLGKVIMPILLEDHKSIHFKNLLRLVENSGKKIKSVKINSVYIYNRTKYGVEFYKEVDKEDRAEEEDDMSIESGLSTGRFVLCQYFVKPDMVHPMREKLDFEDHSDSFLDGVQNALFCKSEDGLMVFKSEHIEEDKISKISKISTISTRAMCIWVTRPK